MVGLIALGVSGCAAAERHTARTAPAALASIPSSPALAHATSTAVSGRQLIAFHRVFGTDPLASTLTVYAGGRGVATLGYGGRNGLQVHRFRLPAAQLRGLVSLIDHARLHTTDAGDFHDYIYWVTTARGSYRLRDGLVPRSARPLIAALNTLTNQRTGW